MPQTITLHRGQEFERTFSTPVEVRFHARATGDNSDVISGTVNVTTSGASTALLISIEDDTGTLHLVPDALDLNQEDVLTWRNNTAHDIELTVNEKQRPDHL